MALTADSAPVSRPASSPPRIARWLWLATTGLAAAAFVALVNQPAAAQDRDAPRLKTESPYFFVKSDDPSVDTLPLKSTQVNVRISGVIAEAAAQHYFGLRAHEIDTAQAVWLAAMLHNPALEARRWADTGHINLARAQWVAHGLRPLPRRQREVLAQQLADAAWPAPKRVPQGAP